MRRALLAGSAALGALVVARRRGALGNVPSSLPVAPTSIPIGPFEVAAYIDGPEAGRPVVLIHSVNAAASAAEMRPLFDRLRHRRRVVAIDLPGFGRSSRPRIEYSSRLMADGIVAVLDWLGTSVDVVALSLGCEFAAQAALERPSFVHSMALISPTGLGSKQSHSPEVPLLGDLVRAPVVGEALFGLLASRPSIEYFLGKSFHGPVEVDLANHAHLAARHRDARFAPASFLEGALFTQEAASRLYDHLEMPVLVVADRDPYTDFGALPDLLARKSNWQRHNLAPHRGLPQFDHPDATAELIATFQEG